MPMTRSLIVSLLMVAAVFAQGRKEFEVASIKPTADDPALQASAGLTVNGSQVRIQSLPLKDYIGIAYEMRLNQIIGPDWLSTQRFDIAGKMPDGGKEDDVDEMLQSLLADRFQLKVHREMKEFAVYVMEVTKAGFKAPQTLTEEETKNVKISNIKAGGNADGAMIDFGNGSMLILGATTLEIKKMPMPILADMLGRFLDRPVVDKTDLKASYDMTLNLTPEDRLTMLIRSAVAAGVVLPPQALRLLDTASHDSLSNGLNKYGLTLRSSKEQLEVLVVDSMQKQPTEN